MKSVLAKHINIYIIIACCFIYADAYSNNELFMVNYAQTEKSEFKNEIHPNGDIISMYKCTTYSSDVLQNDYGLTSGVKSIEIFKEPEHGTAHFKSDNKLYYTPNLYYVGEDYLEYKVCNTRDECGVAGVKILIHDYDYHPIAVSDSVSIRQNRYTKIDVLQNDLNLYDLEITLEIVSSLRFGTATVTDDNLIEVFMNDFYIGADSLEYLVCDGDGDCDNAFLKIYLSNKFDISNKTEGFSPNGDGINDFFTMPAIEQYDQLEIQIIDRNGRLVFEDKSYNNKWDGDGNQGVYNGIECPSGVYYYKLNIKDIKEIVTGYIYLNR